MSQATSLILGVASGSPPTTALMLNSPKFPTLPYSPARCFTCGRATIASRHGGITCWNATLAAREDSEGHSCEEL